MLDASLRRILLLVPALGLVFPGCGEAPAAPTDAVVPTAVRVQVVTPERVTRSLGVPGVVEAKSRISLAFRVSGFIERFDVDEGDRVDKGDVLAVLDPADFTREARSARAALERARAHARSARQTFERQQQLRESGTSSQQAHDRAESAHQMAQAEMIEARMARERADDRLGKATLRAPIAGTIERRLAEPHETTSAETPVLVLTELDPVTVRAAAADSLVPRLRVGAPARVRSPLLPDRWQDGTIVRIGVAADAASRTIPFEVELPNPDRTLLPELVVEVAVDTETPKELLLVPMAAVLRDADTSPFCFVAVGEGDGLRAERRAVTIGEIHGDHLAITDGLSDGDRVVVRGQHFLRDTDAVRAVED